ncbi:PREDICTED: uncharacterized protein LOC106148858 [Chinchilla lanigera]|uniref:uncharacterized protein LOC106148858 n=1 Tax=Chinchilla lanigera TaxID=34839 RepID=UPI00069898D1|nr:PREDICTED: uncharacterized protein LOC106148858 [Chinchilla lanigera]
MSHDSTASPGVVHGAPAADLAESNTQIPGPKPRATGSESLGGGAGRNLHCRRVWGISEKFAVGDSCLPTRCFLTTGHTQPHKAACFRAPTAAVGRFILWARLCLPEAALSVLPLRNDGILLTLFYRRPRSLQVPVASSPSKPRFESRGRAAGAGQIRTRSPASARVALLPPGRAGRNCSARRRRAAERERRARPGGRGSCCLAERERPAAGGRERASSGRRGVERAPQAEPGPAPRPADGRDSSRFIGDESMCSTEVSRNRCLHYYTVTWTNADHFHKTALDLTFWVVAIIICRVSKEVCKPMATPRDFCQ